MLKKYPKMIPKKIPLEKGKIENGITNFNFSDILLLRGRQDSNLERGFWRAPVCQLAYVPFFLKISITSSLLSTI